MGLSGAVGGIDTGLCGIFLFCSEPSVTEPKAGIPCRGRDGGGPPLAVGWGAGEGEVCGEAAGISVDVDEATAMLEARAGAEFR